MYHPFFSSVLPISFVFSCSQSLVPSLSPPSSVPSTPPSCSLSASLYLSLSARHHPPLSLPLTSTLVFRCLEALQFFFFFIYFISHFFQYKNTTANSSSEELRCRRKVSAAQRSAVHCLWLAPTYGLSGSGSKDGVLVFMSANVNYRAGIAV